jgi:antirestriction protein ArdC
MARVANPSPAVQKHVNKVVAEFIAGLAKGQIPWAKPWRTFGRPMPYNGSTGKDYRGINAIALQMRSATNEFWTVKQAEKLGGKLVDRSRRCDVIFQAPMDGNKIMDEDADEEEATGFLSTVFAAYPREAFEGLPPSKYAGPPPSPVDGEGHKRSPHVEAAIKATRAKIQEIQSDQAFYSPSQDVVVIPLLRQFISAESYYGMLWHELTHWSGGPKRLHRKFGKTFGDDAYAFEELVAELGAAFCCTALGIQTDQLRHQAYINDWIRQLKSQPTYLMRAAALASQALEFLLPDLHKPIKVAKPKAEPEPKATAKPKKTATREPVTAQSRAQKDSGISYDPDGDPDLSLGIGPPEHQKSLSAWLQNDRFSDLSRRVPGFKQEALSDASWHAQHTGRTWFVYESAPELKRSWRVTIAMEALRDPLINLGKEVYSVTPSLDVRGHDVYEQGGVRRRK